MATVHDRYADVDGQWRFYRETGPAVVLLYGFPSSSFMFRDLTPLPADRIEVSLDRTRLRLEPGQSAVPHGVDRDLIPGEVAPGRKP